MANKWNIKRDFYGKNSKPKIGKAVVNSLLRKGFFVVSREEAEKIKEKYIMQGMQLYHDRYCC